MSQFVLRAADGRTEIPAASLTAMGMRGFLLQKIDLFETPVLKPIQFQLVSGGANQPAGIRIYTWYEASAFTETKANQFHITTWAPLEDTPSPASITTQNFHGPVGNVAGRDVHIETMTISMMLDAVTRTVEQSKLPENQKKTVLTQLRDLLANPDFRSIAASTLETIIRALPGAA